MIASVRLDRAADACVKLQRFLDIDGAHIWQVRSDKLPQPPVADVQARIGGQKLVDRREAANKRVDGEPERPNAEKQPVC